MLTYITTYYNNPEYLEHLHQLMLDTPTDKLNMIIVDDFSVVPAEPLVRLWNDPRVHVYRVTEDKGFNSHGARNLAMQRTTTKWNVLVDIDYKLVGVDSLLQQIENEECESDVIHFFSVAHTYEDETDPHRISINDFMITKDLFWKAKGYDPEFIGFHHGDRAFIARAQSYGPRDVAASVLFDAHLQALRSPFTRTYVDPSMTEVRGERYNEDRTKMFISPKARVGLISAEATVYERHKQNEDTDPTPFTWEQLL